MKPFEGGKNPVWKHQYRSLPCIWDTQPSKQRLCGPCTPETANALIFERGIILRPLTASYMSFCSRDCWFLLVTVRQLQHPKTLKQVSSCQPGLSRTNVIGHTTTSGNQPSAKRSRPLAVTFYDLSKTMEYEDHVMSRVGFLWLPGTGCEEACETGTICSYWLSLNMIGSRTLFHVIIRTE